MREVVISLAREMLEGDWNKETVSVNGVRIQKDYTPQQGFRRARLQAKEVRGLTTLIQANPKKVRDARNKVMVYFERTGYKRVGQVRRKGGEYELVWF